jgi:hypothetical protein
MEIGPEIVPLVATTHATRGGNIRSGPVGLVLTVLPPTKGLVA